MGETVCIPDVVMVPDQPPEAVQLVAFVDVQESVEDWPLVIGEGLADRLSVGATAVGDAVGTSFGSLVRYQASRRVMSSPRPAFSVCLPAVSEKPCTPLLRPVSTATHS